MKLLLTSGGISNDSIAQALLVLIGKPANETGVAFIPTAANVESGDKRWLIKDITRLVDLGFKPVDIVDISALEKSSWLPRLEAAEVLFFSGGNTFHLLHWIQKSGLRELLPELLKTRIWVGSSAGSMVVCPTLDLSTSQNLYQEDMDKTTDEGALGLVDLYILPHLNSPHFPKATAERIETETAHLGKPIYGLDDMSAVKVDGDTITMVSEGKYVLKK